MKNTILTLTIFLAAATFVFAQKQPRTAKEFFAALPSEYMTGTAAERLGTKENPGYLGGFTVKPDYLTFVLSGDQFPAIVRGAAKNPQGLGQLKVYRGKSANVVGLAFQLSEKDDPNPTTDSVVWRTLLLEHKNGKWTIATERLLPPVSVEDAFKVLTENFQMKVKKEDVRVEVQLNEDQNTLLFVAKSRGDESVTTLKLFKWTGANFVETPL